VEYIILFLFACVAIYIVMDDLYRRGECQALPCVKNKKLYYLL
jgi:hypothetical protein